MVGVLWAAAVLLGIAGLGKVLRPGPTSRAVIAAEIPGANVLSARPVVRLVGIIELGVGLAVIAGGGALPAGLLAGSYLLLAGVAWRMLRLAPDSDCGCFGTSSEPVSFAHLIVNGVGVLIGAAAVYRPQPSIVSQLDDQGAQGIVLLALASLLAWFGYLSMTALPALLKIRAKVAADR